MTTETDAPSRWLFGPVSDLLLGCGGAYALIFTLLIVAGGPITSLIPLGLLPLLTLFTGTPHVGATLLRVYERRADRQVYAPVSIWATGLVCLAFVIGVYDLRVGSWLITAYLAWSPWHFTAQNYGIAVMFLGRRGVRMTALSKRFVFWSFTFSWIIVFLSMNGDRASTVYAPYRPDGIAYRFVSLGLPLSINTPLLVAALVGYLVCLVGAGVTLRRVATWRDLGPTALLVLVQALWFTIPAIARNLGLFMDLVPFSLQHVEYCLLWIMFGHSIQYLWITTYYVRRTRTESRRGRYLVKSLLAGGAVWGVPLLLFGPDALGARAVDSGLFLLVAAAVNVHHFILDGVIWKLRDGRIARILLRSREDAAVETAVQAPRRTWIRPLIWTAGVVYALFTIIGTLEVQFGVRPALAEPVDRARLQTAANRLRFIGRDHPQVRYSLGVLAMRAGDLETARRELLRSLKLGPNPLTWSALGELHENAGHPDDAFAAYDQALAMSPDFVLALDRSAFLALRLGDLERAEATLARAVAAAPERDDLRHSLQDLRRRLAVPPSASQ